MLAPILKNTLIHITLCCTYIYVFKLPFNAAIVTSTAKHVPARRNNGSNLSANAAIKRFISDSVTKVEKEFFLNGFCCICSF